MYFNLKLYMQGDFEIQLLVRNSFVIVKHYLKVLVKTLSQNDALCWIKKTF